jgi:Ca2+-binding RTX toxin-like protein
MEGAAGPLRVGLRGNGGGDQLTGGSGADQLTGGAGDDLLQAHGGDDELRGDGGDDVLEGSGGDDDLMGDAGADRIRGGSGRDGFSTGIVPADITIVPDDQPNDGAPGEGDDVGSDVEDFATGLGDDHITGTEASNLIDSNSGDDTVLAGGGHDDINPGSGADLVDGGPGGDRILQAVENEDTLRMRDGEIDAFLCLPNVRPRLEADPFDNALFCISSLRVSSRFHKLRPSKRRAVSLGAACDRVLDRPCRGEMRLVARKGGILLARGLYDVPPADRRSVRLRLTSRGRVALRRSRRVPFSVVIRPVDASPLGGESTIGRGALVE